MVYRASLQSEGMESCTNPLMMGQMQQREQKY
ncbi:MAG: hypothetical protein CM1200mP13_14700 [Candidatus Pelagibacterales bacterium]|nr:MAG: hypothetical protein CM1200mP13_14700 [Pelagibacterales bacterium]